MDKQHVGHIFNIEQTALERGHCKGTSEDMGGKTKYDHRILEQPLEQSRRDWKEMWIWFYSKPNITAKISHKDEKVGWSFLGTKLTNTITDSFKDSIEGNYKKIIYLKGLCIYYVITKGGGGVWRTLIFYYVHHIT